MRDYKWERVRGTEMPAEQKKRQDANKGLMVDAMFVDSCKLANVEPTKRQASKYNNKKGIVYKITHNKE